MHACSGNCGQSAHLPCAYALQASHLLLLFTSDLAVMPRMSGYTCTQQHQHTLCCSPLQGIMQWQQGYMSLTLFLQMQGPCSLSDSQAFDGLSHNFGVVLSSRWHGAYALIAMLIIWRCLHAAFLYMRVRLWY